MPRNQTTGVFTRVSNTFSDPVYGTVIDPTDADALFNDQDGGMTFDDSSPLILIGSSSGVLKIQAPDAASGTLTLPAGTTDFSATGGTGQFVRQDSAGAAFTVTTVPASAIASGEALTKVDDTNVTLALGGTPSTALLKATSLTLGWSGTLGVARGGTALGSITAYNLIIGNGTGTPALLAPSATSGIPLISQGASANPAYGTAVVAGGGTGAVSFTAYGVICAGTTGTGAFQNVVGLGNAGEVLTSAGAGALPTWTAVAGTGTVTSVSVTAGTGITQSGSPITTSGAITVNVDKASAANYYAATSNKVVTTDIIYPSEVTVTYGTTTTFDFDAFINAAVTLTGNITTQTFSNIRAGKAGAIRFIQDGSGNHTTVWNSNLKWAGGSAPTLSTAANAVDVLVYQTISSTYIVASLIKGVA